MSYTETSAENASEILANEIRRGVDKYGDIVSVHDGIGRIIQEMDELREAAHRLRGRMQTDIDKANVLAEIAEESCQVAALSFRLMLWARNKRLRYLATAVLGDNKLWQG